MIYFVEERKKEYLEETPQSKARTNNKLDPQMERRGNQIQATLVGGKRSNHCTSLLTQK